MYLKTKIAKCPECGASIKISNTNEIVNCSHCQSSILIKFEDSLPAYLVEATLNTKDTTSILLSKLKHFLIASDFISKSRILSRTLYYVPFFYITGFKCGEHIIEEKDKFTKENKEDTKVITSAFKILLPATKLSGWGTVNIDIDQILKIKDRLKPLGEKIDKNEVIIKPEQSHIPEDKLNLQFLTTNQNIKTEIIVESCVLIYYPIIRVVLKYRQNIYHYSIDGINGSILYGIAPEAENNRFIPMATAAFFTALFTGGIGKFILNTFSGGTLLVSIYIFPLFLAFVITMLIFIYIAWIFYRNYGEVLIEKERIEINKLNIPQDTFIEKLLRPLFKYIEYSIARYKKRNF